MTLDTPAQQQALAGYVDRLMQDPQELKRVIRNAGIISSSTRAILDAYENAGLAGALRALITEHKEYEDDGCGRFVVFCEDIWNVIDDLEHRAQDSAVTRQEEGV